MFQSAVCPAQTEVLSVNRNFKLHHGFPDLLLLRVPLNKKMPFFEFCSPGKKIFGALVNIKLNQQLKSKKSYQQPKQFFYD